ncbi:hypothetical protein [Sphingomonas sp. CFBP 8764]|uniref:hypothetical protein n=1 Tax=Sphingomonas sp. CFBP 8764 TaxID=2775275 RepID=UPI001783EA87|nr:hypothetical protein [Sphingomonas sp. CFBP 8764]MBD8552546.1 hypothetical protein [Sphingomonas sp. CFBP 8764]
MRYRTMKWARALVAASLLASCFQPRIAIEPCLLGKRLAFQIKPAKRFWWTVTPYISSIQVIERWKDPVWETYIPYGTFEHKRDARVAGRLIVYGDVFDGWIIKASAKELTKSQLYIMRFESEPGEVMFEMIVGDRISL